MRVIPDSDEESDVDLEAESPPRQQPGASAHHTPNLGTASTDSLKQAFATVHHAHLQSSASHDDSKPSTLSQQESKRRVTMKEATTNPVPESTNLKRRTQSSSQTTVSKPGSETIHLLASPYPTESLQNAFARHNALEMFPEASSTVPNASATQRRILERCADPGLGGSTEEPLQLKRLSPDPLISLSQNTNLESPRPNENHQRIAPPSDDEVVDLDIPKEVYKARPSRSRSQKSAISNAIEYPSQPGNANNSRKRRRTRNDSSGTSSMKTPEKVERMLGMGFTPSKAGTALKQNDGNVERAVHWLLEKNVSEDELVVHHASKQTIEQPKSTMNTVGKSANPPTLPVEQREVQLDATDSLTEAHRAALRVYGETEQPVLDLVPHATRIIESPPEKSGHIKSPVKVQVVIPKKAQNQGSGTVPDNPKATRKKAKRRKTTTEDSGARSEVLPQPSPQIGNTDEEEAKQDCSKEVTAGQALAPSPPPETEEQQLPEKTHQALQPTVTESTREGSNPVTRDSEKKAKPVDQSPSNSTKVPHRVGLSRRARIAPLLRILGRK